MSKLTAVLLALALIAGCHKSVRAQVPVAPAQIPHIQFFSANGTPLAGGKVFTYDAGTTTLRNTYKDAGGVSQNTDPIILDSGGFANIWLGNQAYKFVVQNSLGVQQWSVDNVSGYLGLLNLTNDWTFAQTFEQMVTIRPSDNQLEFGAPLSFTIFDVPPAPGPSVLHFQNSTGSDTVVNRNSTDTLTNKTLTSPTITGGTASNLALTTPSINGIPIPGGPATYIIIANDAISGTTLNGTAVLVSNPSTARRTGTGGVTSGVVGIVVSGAGTTGNATIQQSGQANCNFDNATVAGDYVQISSSSQAACHDAGSTYPNSGQVLGRVLSTNASLGLYAVDLFGPEIQPSAVIFRTAHLTQTLNNAAATSFTVTWSSAFADTNYSGTCTVVNAGVVTAAPLVFNGFISKSAASAQGVIYNNLGSGLTSAAIDCMAIHD